MQSRYEVLILRPTIVFHQFLKSQLKPQQVPKYSLLHLDNTAYIVKRCSAYNSTVDYLQANFQKMFRYEIQRWLGSRAINEIENSFLDFVSCFAFDFHNHILHQDKSLEKNTYLLELKPKLKVIDWLKRACKKDRQSQALLEKASLRQVAENSTLIAKSFSKLSDVKPFVNSHYKTFFQYEMKRMCTDATQWPTLTQLDDFSNYYSIELHTQLVNMTH